MTDESLNPAPEAAPVQPNGEAPPHVDQAFFDTLPSSEEAARRAGLLDEPAAWEAEVHAFWENIVRNVSTQVATPIHNFIHAEVEALKARLKAIL